MFPVFPIFFVASLGLFKVIFEFTGKISFSWSSPDFLFLFVLFSVVLWHLFDFRTNDCQLYLPLV